MRSLRLAIGLVASILWVAVGVPAGGPAPVEELRRLCDEYWQGHLEAHPLAATLIGDPRYDDRLADPRPGALRRERRRLTSLLERARKLADDRLGPADRLSRAALVIEIEGQLDRLECGFEDWSVDPLDGPQVEFMNVADYTRIDTPADAERYVARCRAMSRYLDRHLANLRRGRNEGRVASVEPVKKTLAQLEDLTSGPESDLAVLRPLDQERPDWPAADRKRFREELTAAVRQGLRPALVRYRDFLKSEILPAARPSEKAGLVGLPGGRECYQRLIRVHTSLDRSPEELHRLGRDQVARVRAELSDLGGRALGTTDLTEIQQRLRTDPAMQFSTAAEVEDKAKEALARAAQALPAWFGIRPVADCEVKVMGLHEAPYSTVAYYRQPSQDGSRPGYYMINTYKPETRPRYEAEALAFHESIPGHHLQIAIAQELTGLPEFRKHQGVTAFVEGWALYTERLSDEMGLYSGDLDRIGMLSYDAWRACRLVVDTGLHALGWSRQQAIDYMLENTVLAENNIVNEVDRYITNPGQALAYKVGQLEILKLRDEARERLGERFDIKAFHDAVLGNGAVALPLLRAQVAAYAERPANR